MRILATPSCRCGVVFCSTITHWFSGLPTHTGVLFGTVSFSSLWPLTGVMYRQITDKVAGFEGVSVHFWGIDQICAYKLVVLKMY